MAERILTMSEKTLKDAGDKAKPEDKREVEDAITAVKAAMQSEDIAEINAKTQTLTEAIQKVGSAMYEEKSEESSTEEPKEDEAKSEEKTEDTADKKE
jgi:molecular chaperone DnaK